MFKASVSLVFETAHKVHGGSLPFGESDFTDMARRVSAVRLSPCGADDWDQDTLYVLAAQEAGPAPDQAVAVCRPPAGCTQAMAHGLLQDALDRCRARYEECLQLICTGSSTDKVLAAAAADLDNPVAFVDDVASIVYQAGEFSESVEGTMWEDAIERGYMDPTFLSDDEQIALAKAINGRQDLVTGRFENDPAHSYAIVPLYDDGVFCGGLICVDVNKPFTAGQLDLLRIAGHITYLEGVRKSERYEVLHGAAYYASRLLQGATVKEGAVVRALAQVGWKETDACMVYRFETPHYGSDTYLVNLYGRLIRNALPDALWMHHDGALVAVCRKRDFDGSDAAKRRQLDEALRRTRAWCAVSASYVGFMNLRTQHTQCKLTLRVLPGKAEGHVASFDELYPDIVREALGQTLDAACVCDPVVLQLAESGDAQDAVRLESLKVFLMNGRSVAAASRILGIHRSTMLYRLERLQKMLGVDLGELDDSQLTRLMLSCLLVG